MNEIKIGDCPALDKAEKLLKIITAYFSFPDNFDLTLLQLSALHRETDKVLDMIRNLSFKSCVEDSLHEQKLLLHRRIMYLIEQTGSGFSRKRKSLPTLDLDRLLEQIEILKDKKKVA